MADKLRAASDAVADTGGKIEEACTVLSVLKAKLDGSGHGADESAVLAVVLRDLAAQYRALYDIAEDIWKLDPARSGNN